MVLNNFVGYLNGVRGRVGSLDDAYRALTKDGVAKIANYEQDDNSETLYLYGVNKVVRCKESGETCYYAADIELRDGCLVAFWSPASPFLVPVFTKKNLASGQSQLPQVFRGTFEALFAKAMQLCPEIKGFTTTHVSWQCSHVGRAVRVKFTHLNNEFGLPPKVPNTQRYRPPFWHLYRSILTLTEQLIGRVTSFTYKNNRVAHNYILKVTRHWIEPEYKAFGQVVAVDYGRGFINYPLHKLEALKRAMPIPILMQGKTAWVLHWFCRRSALDVYNFGMFSNSSFRGLSDDFPPAKVKAFRRLPFGLQKSLALFLFRENAYRFDTFEKESDFEQREISASHVLISTALQLHNLGLSNRVIMLLCRILHAGLGSTPANVATRVTFLAASYYQRHAKVSPSNTKQQVSAFKERFEEQHTHLFDWLSVRHQSIHKNQGYQSLLRASEAWVAYLDDAISKGIDATWRPLLSDEVEHAGLTARQITSARGLAVEGRQLDHCVGGQNYVERCIRLKYLVFSIRPEGFGDKEGVEGHYINGNVATLGIRWSGRRYDLDQLSCHQNNRVVRPTPECEAMVDEILKVVNAQA